jgi:hypothetical protein
MPINPANASELATIAREVGGEILEGALHYPSETGSWQLGGVELGKYLAKDCDQRLMIILVPLSKATKEAYIGSVCGFVMRELQGFPR